MCLEFSKTFHLQMQEKDNWAWRRDRFDVQIVQTELDFLHKELYVFAVILVVVLLAQFSVERDLLDVWSQLLRSKQVRCCNSGPVEM